MSAIPTDEPAQDPPPSIEPQQLQHLQQQQLQQQQQLADVQSPPTTDQTRKRTYFIFSSPGRGLISSPYYPQQRHRPYEELALHVTPAKQDVARCYRARSDVFFPLPVHAHSSHPISQSCLKRGLGNTCAYPDPDAQDHHAHHAPGMSPHHPSPLPSPSDVFPMLIILGSTQRPVRRNCPSTHVRNAASPQSVPSAVL